VSYIIIKGSLISLPVKVQEADQDDMDIIFEQGHTHIPSSIQAGMSDD